MNWMDSLNFGKQTSGPSLTGTYGYQEPQPFNSGMNFLQAPPTSPSSPASVTPKGGGGWFDWLPKGALNSSETIDGVRTDTQGWAMPALQTAQGLMSAWMGMKQYGLAKETLAEGKRQFGANYDAQRTTTNAQLEDRQKARYASNPGAYESVGSYMQKNAIKAY